VSAALRIRALPAPDELGPSAEAFLARLDGPTLVRVPGRDRTRTRALVTLLHGNEPSGLRALHAWLRTNPRPAVDLLCIVAAVETAQTQPLLSQRILPGRRDLNRCFRGPITDPEGAVADAILDALRAAHPEALVDLHNNTGHNPPYGVASRIDLPRRRLTWLFASRLVHNTIRLGALTEVLADELPAVTIECGRAGDAAADAVALAGLERYASAVRLDDAPPPAVHIFERAIRVSVQPGTQLAFASAPAADADLTIVPDVDRHNFARLEAGTLLGWCSSTEPWPLEARGDDGCDVTRALFRLEDGRLTARRTLIPIMMTTDSRIARQDCLFYAVDERDPAT
jgi:hypothetical protein